MPPTKKQKREATAMPPEYLKGPGKPGYLHPHWRTSFPDDEADADGRGKLVDVPDALRLYGDWRRVPGFWKIVASDEGFITTEGEWVVRTPTVNAGLYLRVGCNGENEAVHNLVARAFKGRPTAEQISVDHIGGKKLPMAERRQDNRAVNLKWATYAEQRRNQREKRKPNSNGEPCLVWQVKGDKLKGNAFDTTPVAGTAQRFPSMFEASKALGLDSRSLSGVFSGKNQMKTVGAVGGARYAGKWDPDLVDLEGEEWKEVGETSKNRLLMSNYGRLQRFYPRHEGTKFFPESSNADGYLMVHVNGKDKLVHVLVGELFFIGPKPLNWKIWDHKDRDKQNNHIGNLRPVTREDNGVNTARQRDFYLWPKDDPDNWVRCVSQSAAARAYGFHLQQLNEVLHKRMYKNSVLKTVKGYRAAWCDEVDGVDFVDV